MSNYVLSSAITKGIFEYLLDQPCRQTIGLVTELQRLPNDNGNFIWSDDIRQKVVGYLGTKPNSEVMNAVVALNTAETVPEEPVAPPVATTAPVQEGFSVSHSNTENPISNNEPNFIEPGFTIQPPSNQ